SRRPSGPSLARLEARQRPEPEPTAFQPASAALKLGDGGGPMKVKLFAFALLFVAEAARAQSMNAEPFYQRASALQRKGFMALFSGDIKVLTNEGGAAGTEAREQRLADVAAGRKPRYCPPQGKVSIGSDEFMK